MVNAHKKAGVEGAVVGEGPEVDPCSQPRLKLESYIFTRTVGSPYPPGSRNLGRAMGKERRTGAGPAALSPSPHGRPRAVTEERACLGRVGGVSGDIGAAGGPARCDPSGTGQGRGSCPFRAGCRVRKECAPRRPSPYTHTHTHTHTRARALTYLCLISGRKASGAQNGNRK